MTELKIYLIRHAESCSNIARNDLSTLHDKPDKEPLFNKEQMLQLRSDNDDSGEYTSFRYHPSLTQNGVEQVLQLREKLKSPTEAKNDAAEDIMINAGTIFISSATLRTVMTALLLIQDRVLQHIKNKKSEPLIRIFPHLNEAISSKVKEYTKDIKNIDEVEKFIKTQVKADFAIPYEIIKDVIRAGITWLVQNKYYDINQESDLVEDILGVIDFEYYITYCKKIIPNGINPYLQDMNMFKKCLYDEYLKNEIHPNTFVLFVHFKVILNELTVKGKLDATFNVSKEANRGDNACIWLENAVVDVEKGFQMKDITLIDEGPKVRKYKPNFRDTENESICYVNFKGTDTPPPTIDNLTYRVNEIYDSMDRDNSTTLVTYAAPPTKGGRRTKKRTTRKKRGRSVSRKSRRRRNSRKN
jgi:hypothetical protein